MYRDGHGNCAAVIQVGQIFHLYSDHLNLREIIMETKIKKRRKATVNENHCVACGCCVKVCRLNAIAIWRGIKAKIDSDKCVGCGKCAKECPASVITIREVIL